MRRDLVPLVVVALLFLLWPCTAAQAETPEDKGRIGPITEIDEIAGAEFPIEIPENWNGCLLIYAHGYLMVTQPVKRVAYGS